LWGEDRILVSSGRLIVTWRRGLFRRSRAFERDAIRRIALVGRTDRLALEAAGRRIELSALGSRSERVEAATALRAELGIAEAASTPGASLPPEWEVIVTPEGERAVIARRTTRRAQAAAAGIAAAALAAVSFAVARRSLVRADLMLPTSILFVFTAALGS